MIDSDPTASSRRSLLHRALLGAVGFALPSLLVFGSWAVAGRQFYRSMGGEAGAYAAWALLFLITAPLLLSRLLAAPGKRWRFTRVFAAGFLAYAAAWCAGYMILRGPAGEWLGSIAGSLAYTAVLQVSADRRSVAGFLTQWGVFTLLHSLGYFSGSWIFEALHHSTASKILWGVTYGLGTGAAIGAVTKES